MSDLSLQETFRAYLLDSGFLPGDKLPSELELAAKFKVSRGAVREVIMYFSFMGLLERTKNKGTFIRQVEPEKIESDIALCFQLSGFCFEDLKETRLCMEIAMLPLLVRRITPSIMERMQQNIERMESLAAKPEEADTLDRDFHLILLEACGNKTLRMFSNVIHLLFSRKFRQKFLNTEAVLKSVRDHKAMLEALRKGDAVLLQKIMQEHIIPT